MGDLLWCTTCEENHQCESCINLTSWWIINEPFFILIKVDFSAISDEERMCNGTAWAIEVTTVPVGTSGELNYDVSGCAITHTSECEWCDVSPNLKIVVID